MKTAAQLPPAKPEQLFVDSVSADNLPEYQAEELRRRTEHAKAHPEDGISWEEWKHEVSALRGVEL